MVVPFLEFSQGPLFKFCFAVMVLGLLRIAVISVAGMAKAVRKAGDKNLPYQALIKEALEWLVPFRHIASARAFLSISSFLFHIGLVLVPVFLLDHILLWRADLGLRWPGLNKYMADALTLLSIAAGLILLYNRLFHRGARFLSGFMDYLLPVLILAIFASGYIASRPWNPFTHEASLLVHVLCGNALLALIPFTKLAHCLLYPLLRLASSIAWHFPPGAGEAVNQTLYGEEVRKV